MRRTRSLMAALGSFTVFAACQPAAETAEQAEARMATETSAARTAIEAANAQMAAHMNAERYDSAAMLYAEDARALAPNTVVNVGRAAILKSLQGMAGIKGTIGFVTTSVAVNGPLAVETGTYSFTFTPPGAPAPVTDTGKYMAHWHKMGDHWMIVENIWNSDLPPMPEPPKKN